MLSNDKKVQVLYLAVAREKDETVLASTVTGEAKVKNLSDYEEDVKKVMRAPDYNFNTTYGSLYRITNTSACHFIRIETGTVYFVISTTSYPQDKCRLLLADIIEGFKSFEPELETAGEGKLSDKGKNIFIDAVKCHGVSACKMEDVQTKLESVKDVMTANVEKAEENKGSLENVTVEAEKNRQALEEFEAKTRKLKRIYRQKRLCAITVVIIIVIAIGLAIWFSVPTNR